MLRHGLRLVFAVLVLLCLNLSLVSCSGSSPDDIVSAAPNSEGTAAVTASPTASPAATPVDAATALANIQAGNARYVAGTNYCYVRTEDRPMELNSIQHPEAVVIGCSDSRVDPQLSFDQAWGQLFICRVAGNIADPGTLGSTEYAITALQTKLIVVLGHEQCGAVNAALKGKQLGGELQTIIDAIVPAVQSVAGQPGDPLENSIIANIQQTIAQTMADPVIATAVQNGGVRIVGALYTFETGAIEFLH